VSSSITYGTSRVRPHGNVGSMCRLAPARAEKPMEEVEGDGGGELELFERGEESGTEQAVD
jgi:hypothetical protein